MDIIAETKQIEFVKGCVNKYFIDVKNLCIN